MANSKQKPVLDGAKRSPGKSKFSIPRKETPPIDGSYLDRLFADYDRQSKELKGQTAGDHPEAEVPERQQVTEITRPAPSSSSAPPPPAEATPAEVSQTRPPEVTVPIPLEEVVPAELAELPAPDPSEASGDSVAGDVQTSGVIEQEQSAFVRPLSSSNDEALLERWKKRHRLSKGEVKVLRVMARMCREADGDHCYVKIPQLMKDAELKERQTQLVLRGLQALGLVEKLADYSNADRMGTKYRVIFESE